METQKVAPPPNPKRTPPEVPFRPGPAVPQSHRSPPPVPVRPPTKNTNNLGKVKGLTEQTDQTEMNNFELESKEPKVTKLKGDEIRPKTETSKDSSPEGQSRLESGKLEQNIIETQEVALRRPHRPPPLPPRPKSSVLNEGPDVTEACSVESQTSPRLPVDTSSQQTPAIHVYSEKPSVSHDAKPQLKPKPKPRPRPRPSMGNTSGKLGDAHNEASPPGLVSRASQERMAQESDDEDDSYNEVPAPRPVPASQRKTSDDSDDQGDAYNEVPAPRPVQGSQQKTSDDSDQDDAYNEVPVPRPVQGFQEKTAVDKPYNQLPPLRPVRFPQEKKKSGPDEDDEPYTQVPLPRPVGRAVCTQGESSRGEMDTSLEREQGERLATKRTEPKMTRNEAVGEKLPVPAPRIKRVSHSLGEVVERKLHIEGIDLAQEPYSDQVSCWQVFCVLVGGGGGGGGSVVS